MQKTSQKRFAEYRNRYKVTGGRSLNYYLSKLEKNMKMVLNQNRYHTY